MHVSDFDYNLPAELIAQYPAPERSASRMMVMHRHNGACELRTFKDFPNYLHARDCLVINNTKVMPARLFGRRHPSGGKVEAFLLEDLGAGRWHCLLRPGRRLQTGAVVHLEGAAAVFFTVLEKREDGTFEIQFTGTDLERVLQKCGRIPLPPYIQRTDEALDHERYQTVYARHSGAVAAPTAGLHFTPEILAAIRGKGVAIAEVTLHVGAGTFKPVQVKRVDEHEMHEEIYQLDALAAAAVNDARTRGGRVIAVGTTSVRVLETCAIPGSNRVQPGQGRTRIFLHPPMRPQVTDALLTNFHLPRSTLLMLVSTFSSTANVLAAYQLAVQERFHFYSYGDCMLLI